MAAVTMLLFWFDFATAGGLVLIQPQLFARAIARNREHAFFAQAGAVARDRVIVDTHFLVRRGPGDAAS